MESDYYPEAHQWAIEKKLTLFSNSDIHNPLNLDYSLRDGDHRPITLVFAKERTLPSIKEALTEHRTAVYSGNQLIGEEQFLKPIFEKSISVSKSHVKIKGTQKVTLQICNMSDLDYELELVAPIPEIKVPKNVVLFRGERQSFFQSKALQRS